MWRKIFLQRERSEGPAGTGSFHEFRSHGARGTQFMVNADIGYVTKYTQSLPKAAVDETFFRGSVICSLYTRVQDSPSSSGTWIFLCVQITLEPIGLLKVK